MYIKLRKVFVHTLLNHPVYKILLTLFKCIHGSAPDYLEDVSAPNWFAYLKSC